VKKLITYIWSVPNHIKMLTGQPKLYWNRTWKILYLELKVTEITAIFSTAVQIIITKWISHRT